MSAIDHMFQYRIAITKIHCLDSHYSIGNEFHSNTQMILIHEWWNSIMLYRVVFCCSLLYLKSLLSLLSFLSCLALGCAFISKSCEREKAKSFEQKKLWTPLYMILWWSTKLTIGHMDNYYWIPQIIILLTTFTYNIGKFDTVNPYTIAVMILLVCSIKYWHNVTLSVKWIRQSNVVSRLSASKEGICNYVVL